MKERKTLLILVMSAIVLSFVMTPAMATTSVSNLWSNPNLQGSASWDYYESIATCSFFHPIGERHLGRVDVVYKVKYITNDDPHYDYYGVFVEETVTPSKAMSGSSYDTGHILRGVTYFKLLDNDQIAKDILPKSGTTGINRYGIGCVVGNGDAEFTTTSTRPIPNVFVSGYHSSIYGSDNNWVQFRCSSAAEDDSNTYRWTTLMKVREGQDLYMRLVVKSSWRSTDGWGFPLYPSYEESITIQIDGTPSGGGGSGGGFVFT